MFLSLLLALPLWSTGDDEERILMFEFAGRSEVMQEYLRKQQPRGRFHAVFIVPALRAFPAGDLLIREIAQQLRRYQFSGSVTAIVRIDRYYAESAYLRSLRWNIPVVMDTNGTLLKAIHGWKRYLPILTMWDSTGTLWWWAVIQDVPTGDALEQFLDSLGRSTQPLLSQGHYRALQKPAYAVSVGQKRVFCDTAQIQQSIFLRDDSVLAAGQLWQPIIDKTGKWLVVADITAMNIRVYDLQTGEHLLNIVADSAAVRGRSWFLSESELNRAKDLIVNALTHPQMTEDSIVWTIQASYYVRAYHWPRMPNGNSFMLYGKAYYLLGYQLPNARLVSCVELDDLSPFLCQQCHDRGVFYITPGLVVGREYFYLPYRRGYLVTGAQDTSLARNPYDNPLFDEFYTAAPLFGAFDMRFGRLSHTLGVLNRRVGKKFGLGLAFSHDAPQFSCDQSTGLCAWVEWLVPKIYFSDGRTIPLVHYWNTQMLDTNDVTPRFSVPRAREISYIRDSAGAAVQRVILTSDQVFIFWKVKEYGYPLYDDDEQGFYVVQGYNLANGSLVGQWHLPHHYHQQRLIDIGWDPVRKQLVGLYQNAFKTTLAYYLTDVPLLPR